MRLNAFSSAVVATLSGSVIGGLLLSIAGYVGETDSIMKVFLGAAAIAFYGFLLALPFVFLYGMPLYAVLRRTGRINMFTGVAIGAAPGAAWILWTKGSWMDPVLLDGVLIGGLYVLVRKRYSSR